MFNIMVKKIVLQVSRRDEKCESLYFLERGGYSIVKKFSIFFKMFAFLQIPRIDIFLISHFLYYVKISSKKQKFKAIKAKKVYISKELK